MASGEEPSIEDLLAEAVSNQRTATARVLLRQDLLDHHAALSAELEGLVDQDAMLQPDEAKEVAARLVVLEAEIDAARRPFTFKAIGRRAWQDLLAAHGPTKQQREQFGVYIDYNPVTFPAAAVAASSVSPKMTIEQAEQFERVLNASEWDRLFAAARDVNVGGGADPKSLLAGRIAQANAELGLPPHDSESLAASSSVE